MHIACLSQKHSAKKDSTVTLTKTLEHTFIISGSSLYESLPYGSCRRHISVYTTTSNTLTTKIAQWYAQIMVSHWLSKTVQTGKV